MNNLNGTRKNIGLKNVEKLLSFKDIILFLSYNIVKYKSREGLDCLFMLSTTIIVVNNMKRQIFLM